MKIFFVQGIGHADLDQNYYVQWETDVTAQLRSCGLQSAPQYEGLTYDPLFQQYDHGPATYAAALVEFLGSAAVHSVTDPLTAAPPGTRGFFYPSCPRHALVDHSVLNPSRRRNLKKKGTKCIRFYLGSNRCENGTQWTLPTSNTTWSFTRTTPLKSHTMGTWLPRSSRPE